MEGGLINWLKRRRLSTVLKDIQQYQQKPYHLESVAFIQEYLLNYTPLDEDQCYNLSLSISIYLYLSIDLLILRPYLYHPYSQYIYRESRVPEKDGVKRKSILSAFKKDPSAPGSTVRTALSSIVYRLSSISHTISSSYLFYSI